MMITDIGFRTPNDLSVSDLKIRRVLVIGSCLVGSLPELIPQLWPGTDADWILQNNAGILPAQAPRDIGDYDFQIVQIATPPVIRARQYIPLRQDDPAAWQTLFEGACERLALLLDQAMQYNREHGLLTFVSNFLVPQQNPVGRLLPRGDYRDLTYFFRALNRKLDALVQAYPNAYVLDVEEIAASLGKRYLVDDAMVITTHNAVYSLADDALDQARIGPLAPIATKFESKAWEFVQEMLHELRAHYRTLCGTDAIKLVVTDLDDTLWRGVCGEWEGPQVSGGWPSGYAEALSLLTQRGILLGVISKNDPDTVRRNWSSLIAPDTFTIMKINWHDKAVNMAEILDALSLLPDHVLFIDDNPLERDAMRRAFPAMRVAGDDPRLLRRLLLWSAELQLAVITRESAERRTMVDGQLKREEMRRVFGRAEFLADLGLRVTAVPVAAPSGSVFNRCLELINKTNQFNTTGTRWSHEALAAALAAGTRLLAFDCVDRFTRYGIVCAVVATPERVTQMVLSCRVLGLGVEDAVLNAVVDTFGWRATTLRVDYRDTGRNRVCLDSMAALGLVHVGDQLACSGAQLVQTPAHVSSGSG
jgi:FkbH-like protein